MRKLYWVLFMLAGLGLPGTLAAQDWGDLDGLLAQNLAPTQEVVAGYWLPDSPDPGAAVTAVGIVYPYIEGSAGNTGIVVGLFGRADQGFRLERIVEGIFGLSPGAPVFYPDRIELTTATLGPDDARCCPSQETRWSIDRATGVVTRLD